MLAPNPADTASPTTVTAPTATVNGNVQGILIDIPLSRQDLAEMTGTTLFTVSRTLKAWQSRGLVRSGRKEICVCDPHGLTVIAEDLVGSEADDARG